AGGGGGIQVEVVFRHVFAMVALAVGQAEEALLENRIAPVPERQGKTQTVMAIADTGNTVLIPAVGARSCLVMGEILPGFSGRAVIFPHRAPGALAQVRPPTLPVVDSMQRFLQAKLFLVHEVTDPFFNYAPIGLMICVLMCKCDCQRADWFQRKRPKDR